jgi:hypothetical protein
VLEEIESLKDHADLSPFGTDLFVVALVKFRASQLIAHEIAVDAQLSSVMLL